MIRRHFIGGIILFLAGVYFLIGGLSWLPENSQAMVWPLALIIAGVLFIFKPGRNKRAQWARQHTMEHRRQCMKMHQGRPGMNFESEQQQSESVDGFLRSENVWGALHRLKILTIHISFTKFQRTNQFECHILGRAGPQIWRTQGEIAGFSFQHGLFCAIINSTERSGPGHSDWGRLFYL